MCTGPVDRPAEHRRADVRTQPDESRRHPDDRGPERTAEVDPRRDDQGDPTREPTDRGSLAQRPRSEERDEQRRAGEHEARRRRGLIVDRHELGSLRERDEDESEQTQRKDGRHVDRRDLGTPSGPGHHDSDEDDRGERVPHAGEGQRRQVLVVETEPDAPTTNSQDGDEHRDPQGDDVPVAIG